MIDEKKLIERLEESAEESRKYWNEFDDEDSFGAMNAYTNAIQIVNQLAEEYNDRFIKELLEAEKNCGEDSDCSECPFGQIEDRCILAELQTDANIKHNNGWILCSEQSVPNENGRYEVTCETLWNDGRKSYSTSTLSFYKENGWCAVFGINTKVIAWRKPAPYQPKGE